MGKKNNKNVMISHRLAVLCKQLVGMMAAAAILALIFFQVIGSNMTTFYHVQYETTKNQMEIRKDVQTMNKRILVAMVSNDSKVTAEQEKELLARFSKIEEYIQVISDNLKDEAVGTELNSALDAFENATKELISIVKSGNADKALQYYNSTYNTVSEALADTLNKTGDLSDQAASDKYIVSIVIQVVASVILVLFTIVCYFNSKKKRNEIIRSIEQPLQEIERASEQMAEGNVHAVIEYNSEDEIGKVAESLRVAMESTASYIDDIEQVMGQMAAGKLNATLSREFVGDFENIQTSINEFAHRISDSMHEISMVSEQVASGAGQIADAGQMLAEGATDQAGIVEELSATVTDITQKITENADSAIEISKEVKGVTDGIAHGNDRMKEVVGAMDTISTSSQEIGNIIDTINDIAAQTNLLALNASIEAARAGEAGRGFAVVANQVSSLASQSAEAAQTSTKLIKASLDAVVAGKELADDTAAELNQVVQNAEIITEKVDAIAAASSEQAEAVKQVDIGIGQIAQVVETNAATAQESSASSEELTSQATTLQELVNRFELR